MGKSQIALQIAHLVKNNADEQTDYAVFWISASSTESFEQACFAIVSKSAIGHGEYQEPKAAVRDFLSSDKAGSWFLVFDGIDDIRIPCGPDQRSGRIADWLPDSTRGHILFTTRSHDVAALADDVLEIPGMSMAEAKNLLQTSLIRKTQSQNDAPFDELLQELDQFPLAIAQASAYMNMNGMPIKEYLQLLQNAGQNTFSPGLHDGEDHYLRAFVTACTMSINQICKTVEDTAELLHFISSFELNQIPLTLLLSLGSQDSTKRTIGTLCGYNLLTQQEDGEIFDVHELVQSSVQSWATSHSLGKHKVEAAMVRLSEMISIDGWESSRPWRRYLPHALKILDMATGAESEEAVQFGDRVSRCLLMDGQIQRATSLLEHMVAIKGGSLAKNHPSRLASLHTLAGAYEASGRMKEACDLLEHVVAEEETLAEDHRSRLASQHALALVYQAIGRTEEAIQLLRHVVAVREKIMVEGHPDLLVSRRDLNTCLWQQKRSEPGFSDESTDLW